MLSLRERRLTHAYFPAEQAARTAQASDTATATAVLDPPEASGDDDDAEVTS